MSRHVRSRLAALATAACLAPAVLAAQVPTLSERVDVARVVVDVHVLDDAGRPVTGLAAEHFRLWVDGRPVAIESVRWTTAAIIDRAAARGAWRAGATPEKASEAPGDLPSGRLVVLFVQKDLEPSRLEGLAGLLRRAQSLVDGLEPDDWLAVLSFEHHLDLRLDFTRDRRVARDVIGRQLLLAPPPAPSAPPGPGSARVPSLVPGYDADAARRAASMEQALLVTARLLDRLPGTKDLVILGHGFGRILMGDGRAPSVGVDAEYRDAARLLARARVVAYALDVTQADDHTLAAGLELVAADTGGFYLQTHTFPALALARLGGALAGRYALSFEKPAGAPGAHTIRIELVGRRGRVLARRSYVG